MSQTLRLVSYNLFKGRFWWSGQNALEPMAAALKKLNPDFVFLQEFRGFDGQSKEVHDFFRNKLGFKHGFYGKNYVSASSDHGNAIYSKTDLIESVNHDLTISKRECRGLVTSKSYPWGDETPLYLFCTHLDLGEENRMKQLSKLCDQIETILPKKDSPFILAGDFNDWRHTADQYLADRLELKDAFRKNGGSLAKTFPSFYPMLELDRIYIHGLEAKSTRVLSEGFRMLSDHLPLMVEVER